jgi:hypothetical protein
LPASPQGPRELRHARRPHTVEEETSRPARLLVVPTINDALAELRRCAGTQFDPEIVPIFEQVLADRAKLPTATKAA